MAVSAPYFPNGVPVFMGLSTDTMPTTAPIGAKFFQTDTQYIYVFTNAGTWKQVGATAATPSVII
jgi:hypothetical protein